MKTCSHCERRALARGLCGKHYQRWAKYGDPTQTAVIMGDDVTRFWSYVERSEGCWAWVGNLDKDGYGRMQVDGKARKAHRLAWLYTHGEIADGLYVCHACDNRRCCRPEHHLWLGTNDDNMADCTQKGRRPSGVRNGTYTKPESRRHGDVHGSSRLTSEQVAQIRTERAMGTPSRELAERFGVSHGHINRIVRGDNWR